MQYNKQQIKRYLCYGLYGLVGVLGLTIITKETIEHLDFRIIEQLGLYREDEFFESTTDKEAIINKLFEAIEKNKNITEEQALVFVRLKDAIMEHPYVDYSDLYQIFRTLKIKESNEVFSFPNGSVVEASYSRSKNICTFYRLAGGSETNLPHESGHIFLGHLSDYFYLDEGITQLYITEYCGNGIPNDYWVNVYCIRILCELIEPSVLLEAQTLDDSICIIQSLTQMCEDEEISRTLLDTMELYCKKDFKDYPTKEDKEQLKDTINLFLSKCKRLDNHTKEQIQEYINLIEFPHIDMQANPIFYFKQMENDESIPYEISKKYYKHKEFSWKNL